LGQQLVPLVGRGLWVASVEDGHEVIFEGLNGPFRKIQSVIARCGNLVGHGSLFYFGDHVIGYFIIQPMKDWFDACACQFY
jgi:hypothetical protein